MTQRGIVRDPIKVMLIGLLTCGFGAVYYLFVHIQEVHAGLGYEKFNLLKEILLSVVTCGLWGIWFQWRFCESVNELQEKWGVAPQYEPIILFVANIFVPGFLVQMSLNNAWNNGVPPDGSGQLPHSGTPTYDVTPDREHQTF